MTPEEKAAADKAKAEAEAKAKAEADAKAAAAHAKPPEGETRKADAALVDDVARIEASVGELAEFVGFAQPKPPPAAGAEQEDSWWKDPFGFHAELYGAPGAQKETP